LIDSLGDDALLPVVSSVSVMVERKTLGEVDLLSLLSGRLGIGERDSLRSDRALLPDSTGRGAIVVFGSKFLKVLSKQVWIANQAGNATDIRNDKGLSM
jgi:hypothetical protein